MSTCALADSSPLCPEMSINGKYIYIYHVTIRYFSPIHFFLIQLVNKNHLSLTCVPDTVVETVSSLFLLNYS